MTLRVAASVAVALVTIALGGCANGRAPATQEGMERSRSAEQLVREATGLAPSFVQERTEEDGSLVWWVEFESETVTRAVVYGTLLAMAENRSGSALRLYFYHMDPAAGEAGDLLYTRLLWNRSAVATMSSGADVAPPVPPSGLEIADGTASGGWNTIPPRGIVTRSDVTTDMIAEAAAGRGSLLEFKGKSEAPLP